MSRPLNRFASVFARFIDTVLPVASEIFSIKTASSSKNWKIFQLSSNTVIGHRVKLLTAI